MGSIQALARLEMVIIQKAKHALLAINSVRFLSFVEFIDF